MKQRIGFLTAFIIIVGLVSFWTGSVFAMSSDNFQITTSVMAGGGGQMSSPVFSSHTVLGQPSPIMEQGLVPFSDNYDLYSGFLYTLFSASFCLWDNNQDGDVDGLDLIDFLDVYDVIELEDFADQFGRTDCN